MMKTQHFEIFEEKHLPPDWEAMEDQLAHWVYDPETFKLILKKRNEEAWSVMDDQEEVLLWYLDGANWLASKDSGRLHYQSYTKAGRLGLKLREIGVNYNDVDGGYSLVPISTYDPLRLFYPTVTDKDSSNISLDFRLGDLTTVHLSFLSDEGLVAVAKADVMDRVHLMEPSWSTLADSTAYYAYKTCLAAWVITASKKTGLKLADFINELGSPILIDRWISQELEGLR